MARKFAQIHVAIWTDEDFKSLSPAEQHMYFVLLSQPRLNLCGVMDYIPSRLAMCVYEWTEDDVQALVKSLEAKRYVVVDYDSKELLLRSFIRRDGLLKAKTITIGAASDYAEVMSEKLRGAIDKELRRAFRDDSTLAGWQGLKEANPVLFGRITEGATK
jgi:hypothetical protein